MISPRPPYSPIDTAREEPDGARMDWWQAVFDQGEHAQIICDRSGRMLAVNQRAAQGFFEPAGAEQSDYDWNRFLSPSTVHNLLELLNHASGSPLSLPSLPVRRHGKSSLLVDVHIRSLTGEIFLVTFKDATRRWRMESHAQRIIAAIDATPDVMFLTDKQFRVTFANAAFQTNTGYPVEEVLGQPESILRAPVEEPMREDYRAAVRAGKNWVGALVNRRADGSTYPVESCISPLYDRSDHFIGCVALERDLSDKKRLQEELLVERNFVRSILNSLASVIYTVGRDFRITHFNEGWKRMPARHGWLKLEEKPELGRNLLEYVADEDRRTDLEIAFREILEEGKAREFRTEETDGFHWQINIFPWRHEEEVRGLICKITDVTAVTVLQKQLYQAQKMETIGALAAGVAHDFNNLLQAIAGNINLLRLRTEANSDLDGRLRQIEQAAKRASEITQQLLSFSRVSDQHSHVLDFNQVVQEAGLLAKRTLRSKVKIEMQPAAEALPVRMDGARAQQLLLNLCVNANDAMPHGGLLRLVNRRVSLSADQARQHCQTEGAPFLCCSVSDTGTGIPGDILVRIFDPFFTTKAQDKGTGLGMAIVKSIITSAEGFLEVQSQVGQGTVFHLYLPLADEEVTAATITSHTGLCAGSGRILVVDDLDLVLEFSQNFLEAAGYDVSSASNAFEALEILENQGEHPIDLVLTDYNMPDKNGWELIQEIAQKWPAIKTVLVTGYMDNQERCQVAEHQSVHILNKPYNISEATKLIAGILKGKS